jgi:FkbM family methyltransferase
MGTSEPVEQQVLAASLQPGDVFYDIGANAGFYAVIAARLVGDHGQVYAFEPTPELAERLKHNANLNGLSNLSVVEAAVCERSGSVRFASSDFHVGNSIALNPDSEWIDVKAIDLDSWAVGHPSPSVVMLDIEGSEIDALRGALGLISENLPILMVEVHWLGQRFIDFVESELAPLGYSASTYDGEPLPVEPQRYHALLRPNSIS